MQIKCQSFSSDKLLILFSIAWLLQLKKQNPNNQLKMKEFLLVDENKIGIVIKFFLFSDLFLINLNFYNGKG